MKCPYCNKNMKPGKIWQDRYALKWVPSERRFPFGGGIRLTSIIEDRPFIEAYYCDNCKILISKLKE
ncbi:PF20097 family protein [[Clostridium] hylemonae]|uniref:DUF6487 domain-containing protein n=1 Tax=[Clostridium] hylemonae DSM 15053 TaxID=553973 RepID=C0BX10_9FIRM|nr:hypothetical protein CLOHYLEM_04344 [[Clostridium] hylemonae DSM 15053]